MSNVLVTMTMLLGFAYLASRFRGPTREHEQHGYISPHLWLTVAKRAALILRTGRASLPRHTAEASIAAAGHQRRRSPPTPTPRTRSGNATYSLTTTIVDMEGGVVLKYTSDGQLPRVWGPCMYVCVYVCVRECVSVCKCMHV